MLNPMRAAAVAAAVMFVPAALAAEVAGVRLDEKARLGNAELVLHGAGVRTRLVFKVYVGALYATKKASTATGLIESREPRRLVLHLLRDLDADSLVGALREGLQQNNAPAELAGLKVEGERFEALMRGIGNARKGDVIALDFSQEGVGVGFNGQARGSVAGEGFARALLKVWLGEKPVDAELKQGLLGG
jgi:long-chain acyl-CoA synthetase